MLSFWLFLLVIALYFMFRGSSAGSSGFSSRVGAGFTYDQIDVRILALAAAVIRSDGKISDQEVRFVRTQFIGQFGQARAEKAFSNYKTFTYKDSLEHICRELMFTTSYQSRQSILVFLFQVAASDGQISDDEVRADGSDCRLDGGCAAAFSIHLLGFCPRGVSAFRFAAERAERGFGRSLSVRGIGGQSDSERGRDQAIVPHFG